MAPWKTALKVFIAVFAVIGVFYTAFFLWATFLLPRCIGKTAAQVISPSGEYAAILEEITCRDVFASHSEVVIAKRGAKERSVALEIRGTSRVDLSWEQTDELSISYPRGAKVEKFGQGTDRIWPRVTYHPTD
jgi:hypothetical protein